MISKLLARHHIHSQMFLRINLNTGEGILHIPISGDCSYISQLLRPEQWHRNHVNYNTIWPISSGFLLTNFYILN